jgi:hypothetical protein
MPCSAPLEAFKPALPGPVLFSKPRNGHHYTQIQLPCGQCLLCRIEHARQWKVRILHEAQTHEHNSFITLTYADKHLPPHNTLNYPDLQKFWKRLRKAIGPIRYFAIGEYGDNTTRPHYHACVFGHAFLEGRHIIRHKPPILWESDELTNAWALGHASVGALTPETAGYTANYVTKKLRDKQYVRVDEDTGELVKLAQPRAFMSLKPAIAREWLETYGKQVYDHDRVIIKGREQKPPKYYDQWLEQSSPGRHTDIKTERRRSATTYTPEQLQARTLNARARIKLRPL